MSPKRFSPLFLAFFLVVIACSAAVARPEERRGAHLALGDSVAFGFITQAGFEYINADNFIGFPSYIGQDLKFNSDAACPGETTGSFLSSTAPDNGCRDYRKQFPLHVSYASTQRDFALSFLGSHPETSLVTVLLGANDLFLLEDACAGDPTCIANGLPQLLATIITNTQTILSDIRETGFKGAIVVVNYYSVDYSDATGTQLIRLLNQALATVAAAKGVIVADVFTAFQIAASSAFAGGNTCRTGLLNALPQNELACDIHPSQSGQRLIARVVERTLRSSH